MDLGTANTIIIHNDKIVVDEPSIVAVDRNTGKLIAIGERARQMHGKTHEDIKTIRPLRDGVIADFQAAELMIRGMIKMINTKKRVFTPSLKMVVCIPSGSTEVERRAVRDSSEHAGGRDVYMIFEPMAAAIGIGLDVEAPEGCMVVDIRDLAERDSFAISLPNLHHFPVDRLVRLVKSGSRKVVGKKMFILDSCGIRGNGCKIFLKKIRLITPFCRVACRHGVRQASINLVTSSKGQTSEKFAYSG